MPKSMVSNSSVLFAHDSRPHFLTFKLVCSGYELEKEEHHNFFYRIYGRYP